MILAFGKSSDPCLQWTTEYIRARGWDVHVADESTVPGLLRVNWSLNRPGAVEYLVFGGERVKLRNVTGVLARDLVSPSHPDADPADDDYIRQETEAGYLGLLQRMHCPVVNQPIPGMLGTPLFARRGHVDEVRQAGFRLPCTLVTSHVGDALAFFTECGNQALLGSITGILPATSVSGEDGAALIRRTLGIHPAYLQQIVDGEVVSIFIIGTGVVAAKGYSSGNPDRIAETSIPAPLAARCLDVARRCGVRFLQMDVVLPKAGPPYCLTLELTPSYDRCDESTREHITASLAGLLRGSEWSATQWS